MKNLGTFNPIRVALHEWASIARDLASARSLREVAGFVFGRPGWSPDGSRETSLDIRARWSAGRGEREAPAKAEPVTP